MTRDDEETRFWSINDELEPDASGQIGKGAGALEPDPGVEAPAGGGRPAGAARGGAADAEATRLAPPASAPPPTPASEARNWLEADVASDAGPVPEPAVDGRRRAPRVRRERRAVWPRILAPVAFLAAVIALFSIVVDSGVLSGDDGTSGRDTRPAATATAKPKKKFYVVKPGDTVSEIASKNGTTVEALLELNPKMSSTTVNPGDRIKLPQD